MKKLKAQERKRSEMWDTKKEQILHLLACIRKKNHKSISEIKPI